MKIRSPYGLGVLIVVFLVVVAITTTIALSIDPTLNTYAQNATTTPQPSQNQTATDTQQIKNYLNQAIKALDSGNSTQALEQVDLAEDQLESMTGTESAEDEDDGEEEEGEIEEGSGEEEDEPGDTDTNDEEDTP
jgi:predicted PurR-regulated permease PerM